MGFSFLLGFVTQTSVFPMFVPTLVTRGWISLGDMHVFFCAVIVTIVICSRKDPFLVVERREGSLFVIYLRCPLENLVSVMMDGAHMGMESKKNHLVKIEPHHPVSY